MKKHYIIPTWLIIIVAIVTDIPFIRVLAFVLAGIQSIQLLLYAYDAWLLKRAKLIIFSIFSFCNVYNEEDITEAEENIIGDYYDLISELEKDIADKRTKANHDINVMYSNAEEKIRVMMQNANNEAAAITYRAEEEIRREIDRRSSQLFFESTPYENAENNNFDDFVSVKSEALNRYIEMVSNIDLPIHKECFLSSEKVNERIWSYIESEYEKVYYMSGFEFEKYCENILQKIGFTNVTVTQQSGDYGADILANKDFVTYAIQCKRYEGNVGNEAIQQIYAAKEYYKKDIAVVMTNSSFTESAKKMASQMNVRLWDKHVFAKFLMLIFLKTLITEQRLIK